MADNVQLSKPADAALKRLAEEGRHRVRELALHLLSLGKNPKPPGSRTLRPMADPVPGSRIWEYPPFEITYQLDEKNKQVNVGTVVVIP
ncbi:hypothetical protein ACFL59_16035 [Planctomycetota bacterium]